MTFILLVFRNFEFTLSLRLKSTCQQIVTGIFPFNTRLPSFAVCRSSLFGIATKDHKKDFSFPLLVEIMYLKTQF